MRQRAQASEQQQAHAPAAHTLPTMADMGLGRDARYFEELGTKKHGSGTVGRRRQSLADF